MAAKKLTMVAAQAVGLAELFKAVFSDGLQGPVPYKVEMSEPDGPSTAGGKLAMQHLKLIPAGGGPTIVMGSANTVEKTVELRSFSYLAGQHAQRFKGASLPLARDQYDTLLTKMQGFFADRGMTVSMLNASPSVPPPPVVVDKPALSPVVIVAIVGAVVALGGAVAFALMK